MLCSDLNANQFRYVLVLLLLSRDYRAAVQLVLYPLFTSTKLETSSIVAAIRLCAHLLAFYDVVGHVFYTIYSLVCVGWQRSVGECYWCRCSGCIDTLTAACFVCRSIPKQLRAQVPMSHAKCIHSCCSSYTRHTPRIKASLRGCRAFPANSEVDSNTLEQPSSDAMPSRCRMPRHRSRMPSSMRFRCTLAPGNAHHPLWPL
jgi:hypothetical protein